MSRVETAAIISALVAVPALIWPLLTLWGRNPSHFAPPDETADATLACGFHEQLHAQLLGLSIQGYERLIARVLCAVGYENVRVLRDYRVPRHSHKGRNRHGGFDLTALVNTEFNTQPVLVQVKQYRRPISRRFVDELRGALVRTQARQGLLITTSTFAPRAWHAAKEDYIAPIHLIDGAGLHDLLVRYRLGVGQNRRGKLYLQKRFFRRLEPRPCAEPQTKYEKV